MNCNNQPNLFLRPLSAESFKQLVLENFNTLKCATGIFKDAQKSNEDSDGQVFILKGLESEDWELQII